MDLNTALIKTETPTLAWRVPWHLEGTNDSGYLVNVRVITYELQERMCHLDPCIASRM